ncbi:hypothetical protein LVJ94_24810 [Pendulispora rubella]|uniref:Phage baseplate protein n=1 Tax=Pendulispora rubella TaxID=2741070 RepID=A0ABZ2LMN7_9BACT
MRALSSNDVLRIWEAAEGRGHVERGLVMLREARPDLAEDACCDLTIGQRDAHLLDLHMTTFGRPFSCVAICPECSERLEVEFTADDVHASASGGADRDGANSNEGVVRWEDYEVAFRVPTSRDLLHARTRRSVPEARGVLLSRCVSAARAGVACDPATLPEELTTRVADRMRVADPQADVRVELSCPDCSHAWTADFDVVSYLWTEIRATASRLIREVHELASRYGWSEDAILALSHVRRQMYLDWGGA